MVIYNCLQRLYRLVSKREKYKTTTVEEFHLPNVPSTEHEYFVKHEIASWLDSLSSLPLERRNVLLLRDYYGFSYKEIAEMTGLSFAKVKLNYTADEKKRKHKGVIQMGCAAFKNYGRNTKTEHSRMMNKSC